MKFLNRLGRYFPNWIWPALGKLFKLLKVAKIAMIGATMGRYAWLFGWQFGVILVLCVLFHEYGHTQAMKLVGVQPKGIWAIPFMGGVAFMAPPETRYQEAVIAFGGPLFGMVSVAPLALIYTYTHNPIWAAYASMIALVNLINLVPIGLLDGGRITQSVVASMNSRAGLALYFIGMAAGFLALIYFGIWILAIVMVMSSLEIYFNVRSGDYFTMPQMRGGQIVWSALGYIALIGCFIFIIGALAMVPGADLAMHVVRD